MKVDTARLQALVDKKLLRAARHNKFPLTIFKYTEACVYSRSWDEYTLMCRGLIVADDGTVIARPFGKFFNIEEHDNADCKLPPLNWNQSFDVMDKVDGSLGIVYVWDGKPYVSTVGSFHSEQSDRANKIFIEKGYNRFPYDIYNITPLFEILYPENRIVVDYCGMEEMILLDAINIETGSHSSKIILDEFAESVGCPVVKFFDEKNLSNLPVRDNAEGYVIRFQDGTRAKMKFEEYKRLHALLTQTNSIRIWESMKNGDDFLSIIKDTPDEFHQWCSKIHNEIQSSFYDVAHRAKSYFFSLITSVSDFEIINYRKNFALKVQQCPDVRLRPILFRMYDKRPYDDLIWKCIKPEMSLPFKQDEEG